MRLWTRVALLVTAIVGPAASSNAQGIQYCAGDGTWANCPCGNLNDGSMSGCDWQSPFGLAGATLSATGSSDLTANNTILTATNTSGNYGVFFAANNQTYGTLSDGLRCAGGGLVRLIPPTSTGTSTHVLPASLQSLDTGAVLGATRRYQYWFRTPGGPCGNMANTTNGYSITWVAGDTYADMVPIPAGTFETGRHVGTGYSSELPVHTVNLDAFYMDVYEVTNQKYADYLNTAYAQGLVAVNSNSEVIQVGGAGEELCDTTGSSSSSRITWNGSTFGVTTGKENHPMVKVSWYGACSYANHLSRDDSLTPCYDETNWTCNFAADGYRLPTEAEWEYAARGGEHNPYYMYPWGNDIDGSKANYANSGDPYETGPYPWTSPVGYYDGNQIPAGVDMANGYGLYDMAGNVWEWCWDWHDANYYSSSPTNNPTGPISGSHRVDRGGGWTDGPTTSRSACRAGRNPPDRPAGLGFRIVAPHR